MTAPGNAGHPRDQLSPYLDDELPVQERNLLDRHLAVCAECREELGALEAMSTAFAAETVPAMPDDLEVRVIERLDLASVIPLPRRFRVPVSIAATIAAVALVGVVLYHQRGQLPLEPVPPPAAEVPSAPAGVANETDTLEPKAKKADARADAPTSTPTPTLKPAPAPRQREAQANSDEGVAGGVPGGVVGGVVGGIEGGVAGGSEADTKESSPELLRERAVLPEAQAPARSSAPAPTSAPAAAGRLEKFMKDQIGPECARGVMDAGAEGRWAVTDKVEGFDRLRQLVTTVGGRVESSDASTGLLTMVVPREKYFEWLRAGRLQGLAGLEDEPPPGEGDCVRQTIRLVPLSKP